MSPINEFQKVPKWSESGDVLDMSRMEQVIDHVKNEERLHPVIGETLPCFGERDVTQPARVADKTAVFGIVHPESKN